MADQGTAWQAVLSWRLATTEALEREPAVPRQAVQPGARQRGSSPGPAQDPAAVEEAVGAEVRFCRRLPAADYPPWEERSARKEECLLQGVVNPGPAPYQKVVHLGLLLRRN